MASQIGSVALIVAGLTLVACTASGPQPIPTVPSVQAAAVELCGFLPDATAVAALFEAGDPTFTTVTAIATAICKVVTTAKVEDETMTPWVIDGVTVTGTFK